MAKRASVVNMIAATPKQKKEQQQTLSSAESDYDSATMTTTTGNNHKQPKTQQEDTINDTILASIETITTSYNATSSPSSNPNKRTTRLNIDPTLASAAKQTIANKLLDGYVLKGRSEICFRCQMPLMVKKVSTVVNGSGEDGVDDTRDNVEEWGNILREYDEDGVCVVCNEADVSEEAFERRLVMFSYAAADGTISSKEENDLATKGKNKFSRQSEMAAVPKQTAGEEMNACLESMEQRRDCDDDKKHVAIGQFDPLIAQDTQEEDESLDETATADEEEKELDEQKEESARQGGESEGIMKRNQEQAAGDEDDLLQFNSNEIIPLADINILPDDITFAIEIMLNNHRCENCAMDMESNAGSGIMECPFCTVVRLDDEVGNDDGLVVDNEEESYLAKLPIYGRIVGVACLDEETEGHQTIVVDKEDDVCLRHRAIMVDEEGDDEETILFDVQEEQREDEEYSGEDEDESILQSEGDDESSATVEDGEIEHKNDVLDFALKADVDEILSQEFVKMWDKELVGEEGGDNKNDKDYHKTEEGQDIMKPADGSSQPPLTLIEVKPMSSKKEKQHEKQVEDTNEATAKGSLFSPNSIPVESVTRTSVAESPPSHTGSPIFEDYLAKVLAEKMENKPSQSPIKNTTAALESACPDKSAVVKNLITKFWKRNMDEQKRKQHQQQKQKQPSTNGWHQLEQAVKAAQNAKKKDMYSELISCNVPEKTVHSLQDVLEVPRQSFKDPPADNAVAEQVRYGSGIDPPSSVVTSVAEISVSGMTRRSSRHSTTNSCTDPPVAKNNRKEEYDVSGVKHKNSYSSINNDHATSPHPGLPESRNDNISVLTFHTADQGLEHHGSSVPMSSSSMLLNSNVGGTSSDLSMNEDDVRKQLRQLEFHFNHMSSSSNSTDSIGIISNNHSNLEYISSQAKVNHHNSVSGINKHPLSTMSWSTNGGHLATISESSAQTPTQSTRHCNISKDPKPLSPDAEARRQRYKKELMARRNKPTVVSIE